MATPIPHNEARFSLADVLRATGGRLRGPLGDEAMEVRGVSTDTRTLRAGELFVALRGERFDGHDHLAIAADKGAALAIVDRQSEVPPGLSVVNVADGLKALGALARAHLDRWRKRGRKVIAITGSAGKTTTRQAIAALLAEVTAASEVHGAAGNLNNLVGVPMTLLQLGDAHRYAVVELGTNRPGEIAALTRMVRPDVAVLTLIASAHAQGLGGIDAIAREKTAIFDALEGIAVGNYDDARVRSALARCRHPVGYGGDAAADYHFYHRRVIDERHTTLRIIGARGEVAPQIGLLGRAGAYACAAAIAVVESMLEMSVSARDVERAMTGIEGRLLPRRAPSGLVVLDDSYNANPASCASSIDAAREIAAALGRRLILVLGEMRELGDESPDAHRELGRVAAASGAARLIAVGGDARLIASEAEGLEASFVETSEQAADVALRIVEPSDVVLVKGSRGVRTEVVVNALLGAAT